MKKNHSRQRALLYNDEKINSPRKCSNPTHVCNKIQSDIVKAVRNGNGNLMGKN